MVKYPFKFMYLKTKQKRIFFSELFQFLNVNWENEIIKAFEVSEIAKQKEAEAKAAKEEAYKLKQKVDSETK